MEAGITDQVYDMFIQRGYISEDELRRVFKKEISRESKYYESEESEDEEPKPYVSKYLQFSAEYRASMKPRKVNLLELKDKWLQEKADPNSKWYQKPEPVIEDSDEESEDGPEEKPAEDSNEYLSEDSKYSDDDLPWYLKDKDKSNNDSDSDDNVSMRLTEEMNKLYKKHRCNEESDEDSDNEDYCDD
jgi:hypothetical protein